LQSLVEPVPPIASGEAVNSGNSWNPQVPRRARVYEIGTVAMGMHHGGPQPAAQVEHRRPFAPVSPSGDENRVRDDAARRQRIKERVLRSRLVEHRGDMDFISGAHLSLSKQLDDALQ